MATGAPAARAASAATLDSPSPPRTASSISKWTARSRATRPAAPPADPPLGAGGAGMAGSWRPVPASGDRGGGVGVRLQDVLAGLAGADAVGLLDGQDEHLAVAHRPGPRVLEDR